jgi:glycosyltransferase involved in cell wall biosynthesis
VLIPTLEIGGAEFDLVRNLPILDPGCFTPIVCTFLGQVTLSAALSEAGVKVSPVTADVLPGRGFADRLFAFVERSCRLLLPFLPTSLRGLVTAAEKYVGVARYVARYMDEVHVDVVHSVLPSAYLIAVMANMLTKRRPLAMSRVSQNWYQKTTPTLGVIERYCHSRLDVAIGNSQAVLKELRAEGIPDHKLMLMHNGIDLATFVGEMLDCKTARERLGIPTDDLVFSCVGNLYERKGHADLLKALHLLKDRLPVNWQLLAAGRDVDGRLAELRQMAAALGLSSHVRLLGERRDIPVLLSAADIHVSASWYESFPNNILEAMCAGLPIIATRVGGVPEQVVDGVTGLLVPAQDPTALSEALLAMAVDREHRKAIDREHRKAMGGAGRARVQAEFPIPECGGQSDGQNPQQQRGRRRRLRALAEFATGNDPCALQRHYVRAVEETLTRKSRKLSQAAWIAGGRAGRRYGDALR